MQFFKGGIANIRARKVSIKLKDQTDILVVVKSEKRKND